VAQVRFANWTADNQLRQAAFLGLREDKPAEEVVREEAAPTPKRARQRPAKAPAHRSVLPSIAAKTAAPEEKPPIRLTHPDKVLDTESGLTKQMLADYYWAIAEHMLPHIAGRPLSLVRCPNGATKSCFYQKHATGTLPEGIGTVMVPDKKTGEPEPYITLGTREALAGLAQMGVLEVHPWGSRNDDLEHPDRIILDLDPDESLPWSAVTEAAADVRARFKKLGLEGFLKTTGGKGLHIVVPIAPGHDWNTIKAFAHNFVLAMEKASPSLYLSKMTKSERAGKIYLDYLRNERGATAVAPYSPRARAGAAVSMPLAWSELKAATRPSFRVSEFEEWRARLKKNPWKGITEIAQQLTREAIEDV
jgi:bifunctional non-homologous end joining protein LigD